MNRFVSLLLVTFSLAAIGLARPVQAQQGKWYRGLPYFLNGNTQGSDPLTTVTASIIYQSTGHVNITSTPGNTSTTYVTSGNYSGSVGVDYVWFGGNPTGNMIMQTAQSLEATGTGAINDSGGSHAGAASGSFSYPKFAWDTKVSPPPFTYYLNAGVPPPTETQTVALGGSIQAYYNTSNSTKILTADVTFGQPVW